MDRNLPSPGRGFLFGPLAKTPNIRARTKTGGRNPAITRLVWGGPDHIVHLAGASFDWQKAETTLMPIDSSECRQHALDCVRLAQTATTPEARKTWSDLAKTWLRFASDLEANECLLDEWGNPRPKKAQTEE